MSIVGIVVTAEDSPGTYGFPERRMGRSSERSALVALESESFSNFFHLDQIPPVPENSVVPLFPTPGGVSGIDEYTFPGGGNDYHQSTDQWTDISGQEPEMSEQSLVTTKPRNTENETQQGVSDFFYPAEDHALY